MVLIKPPPADRMRAFEEAGVWWLPTDPERLVHGTLRFDGEGRPRLELIGMLRDYTFGLSAVLQPPVVLGQTVDGTRVTLLHCTDLGSRGAIGGLRASSMDVAFAILGQHYETLEAVRFRSLAVSYDHLSEWARLTGFRVDHRSAEDGRFSGLTVEYAFPREYSATVDTLEIQLAPYFHRSGDSLERVELTQTMSLEVTPAEPQHLDAYMGVLYHLQNFLALGVGTAVYPVLVTARPVLEAGYASDLERTVAESEQLEILYAGRRRGEPYKRRSGHDMLFGLWDFADDFERYLANWFARADLLKPVYDLYFANLYGSSLYLQTRFLNLAQAIESYHRRTDSRPAIAPELFGPVWEQFQAVIADPAFGLDDDTRKLFASKLAHFNQLGLTTRVREVFDRGGDLSARLIPDRDRFVSAVAQTRNYLTHFGEKGTRVASAPRALHDLTEQLRYLLELSFLRELGMPADVQRQVISRNQHYAWFRERLANDTRATAAKRAGTNAPGPAAARSATNPEG